MKLCAVIEYPHLIDGITSLSDNELKYLFEKNPEIVLYLQNPSEELQILAVTKENAFASWIPKLCIKAQKSINGTKFT